jgi:hypothetical protein
MSALAPLGPHYRLTSDFSETPKYFPGNW